MKPIFTLLMIVLFSNLSPAQQPDYAKLWTEVEVLEIEGLPKSALEKVGNIEILAKKDNNSPQLIKVLLFKSKFSLTLEEDAQLKIISDFKTEIERSVSPTKNVLENVLANLYWQYFQQNRYKFYNRTKTQDKVDTEDFRTWDLQTLFNEIHLHFGNSLKNGLVLQHTQLEDFNVILNQQQDSKIYRPTLYDFLSHNALQFYSTKENSITKPAYKFEINDPQFLAEAKAFSELSITSKDSTSLELNALKIYQDLIRFHSKSKNLIALAHCDIERLRFIHNNRIVPNKDDLRLKTLLAQRKYFKLHPVSAYYSLEIASIYKQMGSGFIPKENEKNKWKNKEALDILNGILEQFPNSKVSQNCKALKSQIEKPELQVKAEAFLPIQSNARLLVTYKNLEKLSFKVHKLSQNQYEAFSKLYRIEEQQAFINKLTVTKQWSETLKNEGDFQNHSVEMLLPKLDSGHYLITANTPNLEANFSAFASLQITDIAVVEYEDLKNKYFQFIDRNNGKPIENAKVKLVYKNYREKDLVVNTTSDSKGKTRVTKTRKYSRHLNIEVSKGNDFAYFENYYVNNYYRQDKEEKTQYNSFLFTDRSIYRPGQTVYFKAIGMKTKNGKSEVLANQDVYAVLYNVNDEEIKELELKTNAFGSVSGEFILPTGGLTGEFYIEFDSESGNIDMESITHFSVEEYKRPKFETNFKPITETFKINDSITIKGEALAFAGSTITDAKVVYRVKRNVQFPRWYYWSRPGYFSSEPQEITQGETKTDKNGNYDITFKAIPDESVDKKGLPVFNYEVTAEVTDLNGETRSTTTIVKVGYHTLTANVSIDPKLDKKNKDHQIVIETKNLNGEFVPAEGSLKIYKLKAPEYVLRTRPWPAPDYQNFSKEKFKSLFPHEAYGNEDNSNHWKKGALVLDQTFNTEKSKAINLGNIKKWESGEYIVALETQDQFGQLVKEEVKTMLYGNKDKTLADKQLFSITTDKSIYKPNEEVVFTLASAARNISVTIDVEKNHKIINSYTILLDNNKKSITIPVDKDDVGGFVVHYSFAAFNSFKNGAQNINVPYPKTDLEIETLTFRDKLQPGTDEKWTFKIKGPKGDKVSAELLASMYDASLDAFKAHNWNFEPVQRPNYYSYFNRNANRCFTTTQFRVNRDFNPRYYANQQHYDQLNWFGFNLNNSWYYNSYVNNLRRLNELKKIIIIGKQRDKYDKVISGTISDENGLPLPGVNIIIKGTSFGTQTDFDGNYSINVKNTDALDYSFVGYMDNHIKIGSKNIYSFSMNPDVEAIDEVVVTAMGIKRESKSIGYAVQNQEMEISDALAGKAAGLEVSQSADEKGSNLDNNENFSQVKIRKNLQETSFFFPQLQTDKDGNVSFSFTTPEALTKWKLQLLAHTKTLESKITSLEAVTQKELMVIPNAPRFLREGDNITISSKIANLTQKELTGQAILQLFDAVSGAPIDANLNNSENRKDFSVDAKGNTQVSWKLDIPSDVQTVQYKIIAKSGDYSDGEQNALPVLTNRMLVTETLPMWVRSNQTKTFTLNKLKTNTSTTLKNHKLTLEMTSNPAWYAVQALPYLMEYPYQCNEQTFSRYYANALASHIANSNPRIQDVFNQWASQDALISNLEKNQELKSILIQETPWLRDAQSETEQKKRIALLFDINKMNNELASAKRKLESNQMASGAWSWFKGGRENRYITQHIITGFGHLKQLNVNTGENVQMIKKAIAYLDAEFIQEYKDITKYNSKVDLSKDHLSYTQLHYLYMRSFFKDIKRSDEVEKIITYYHSQIKKYWLKRSLYAKGMMALAADRLNDKVTSEKILKSLKENSITSEELGMYWKSNTSSWFWHQAPIETQALLIEAFSEIEKESVGKTLTIDNLKIWLLKNKQTNRWKTTKATTDAVYALLLQGSDWLSVSDMVGVTVGGQEISPDQLENVKVEAGTGYYKTSWNASEIKPEMAEVKISKKEKGIAWGGLYWQYFEDLDKITSAETPLKLKKKLFLKTNTDKGESIEAIKETTKLKVGDLVRVRIELRSDRAMEFVHMKDMRAAGLEPINVLSKYKWQDGLGYYESTKDASTNFFFDYLPKGVYVFEYDLRVNNAGNMSNGITTIQSMYAPEFSSHSKGIRVNVE